MLDYTRTWLAVRGITLFNDKRAVTALEYGMIAALIAAVIVGVVSSLGTHLNTAFGTINSNL
ncbi:Flp family type IVb pilin [Acidiphilium sp. PA]|uniref:Flp family type IVb pilin n=1 Tax=Acidiphilium sp. PA TaxID=2871705 RepID=UPI002244D3A7|nr:Flp family type IVb pilin [Acidiphilium sp. PA]MCW8305598.1 Flp family type IVb pilin [Acidiphilium sp. PA]